LSTAAALGEAGRPIQTHRTVSLLQGGR